jgi:hypothetical protein
MEVLKHALLAFNKGDIHETRLWFDEDTSDLIHFLKNPVDRDELPIRAKVEVLTYTESEMKDPENKEEILKAFQSVLESLEDKATGTGKWISIEQPKAEETKIEQAKAESQKV